MNVIKPNKKIFSIQPGPTWAIAGAIIFLSISGVILALATFFSLPDGSVRPGLGCIFFLCSSVSVVALIALLWKSERAAKRQIEEGQPNTDLVVAPIHESVSDKILKWIVTIYSLFFAFDSIALGLICIYALPDQTVQPLPGGIFFLGGALVVASFLFTVWKRG